MREPWLKRLADYKSETLNMSKLTRQRLFLFLALAISGVGLVLQGSAVASRPQRAAAAATVTRNASILATTAEVLKQTSDIRELPILKEVKSGSQSRAEIERMIVRDLESKTTPAEMLATEIALKKLGLVPPQFGLRQFYIKLLAEQVAGYYDTRAQQFYLADWIELEGQKPVMAHELTHALQDQHFNLKRFERWPKGDSDAELAAHALIEGDATLAMKLYMVKNPLVALAFLRSLGATTSSSEQFKQAPRALRESLVFPYERGLEWATRIYQNGGWPKVSEAYKRLPLSSEQILHPEKYLAYEVPTRIALPEVRSLLGVGWKKLDYDVNGEWSYYLILDEFLNAPAESKRAAAGWGGDRYAVYQGTGVGQVFMTQLSAWDTAEDARQFFDAYVKRTKLRYPKAKAKSVGTQSPESQNQQLFDWETDEGGVVIELRGSRVLILEGVPETANEKLLIRTMWE